MKRDRVAEHNRRMWDRLAKAGIPYTRPQERLPRTPASLRKFLDPHGRLRGIRLRGARVLALASGGGWDAVLFAKLGAETALFDISRRQLQTVRILAREERVRIPFVQGNMKDLSAFPPAAFDVVWHAHSLVFVDDAGKVMREVGRKPDLPVALERLASAAHGLGAWERAVRIFAAAATLREAMGVPVRPIDHADYDRSLADLRDQLGETAFAAAWAEGRHMTEAQVAAYALEG